MIRDAGVRRRRTSWLLPRAWRPYAAGSAEGDVTPAVLHFLRGPLRAGWTKRSGNGRRPFLPVWLRSDAYDKW